MINWSKLLEKERDIWHDRFVPSVIAAVAVFMITVFLQRSSFDIVLLTSIASSIVILTNKYKHRLTVLGTAIYAYLVAALVGFLFVGVGSWFSLGLVPVSFLTIATITILIYLLDIFHPPAVGIALGIVAYKGPTLSLLSILLVTFLVFIGLKIVMYALYQHTTFREFHHEFLIWEKHLFK